MSDDTIRAALTLDALVEEVAAAIHSGARASLTAAGVSIRPECNVSWGECPEWYRKHERDAARAALAAVAKAAGKSALEAGQHLTSTYADLCADESTEAHDAARVAALLRTLTEAAP